MEKVVLAWSGGKDSAMALYELQKGKEYEVVSLLTTVTKDYDRISMHGVRCALLQEQGRALGIPVAEVCISRDCTNEEYEAKIADALNRFKEQGIATVAFGDIFLEDLRKYREANLVKLGMKAIFPIWKRDTVALSQSLVALGFKAITTCIDTHVLDKKFGGRVLDESFFAELPAGIDPCGENGEFHTFVFAAPMFKHKIAYTVGEKILRHERFCFCDLLPVDGQAK